jgi:nitrogen fixation protein NifB
MTDTVRSSNAPRSPSASPNAFLQQVGDIHPCFSASAHVRYGRLHLPVAPGCNIQCEYCDRKFDCANESRPGVTSRVMTARDAIDYALEYLDMHPETSVVGIAGPGEPLANEATFETLEGLRNHAEVRKKQPLASASPAACPSRDPILCVSTNGLELPERLDDLVCLGVTALTVTINTVDAMTAQGLYRNVDVETLLHNQQEGAQRAVNAGLSVKINTVVVPGINDSQECIEEVARFARRIGARVMNINGVIPAGSLSNVKPPDRMTVNRLRDVAERHIAQFRCCSQCRADAAGIPGRPCA